MKPQEARIGYLFVASPIANAYIGGLMIVDGRGLPIEFRYTEPIQPTKIQQVLYGSVLSRYIKTEVILETLLKSLDTKPQLLIVNDESFLTKELPTMDADMVRLTETKSGPLKIPGNIEKISAQEFLLQLTAETSPIRVQLPSSMDGKEVIGGPKSLPDKSKDGGSDFAKLPVYGLLLEIGKMMDILEPLKRVEKALMMLCQEAGIKATAT